MKNKNLLSQVRALKFLLEDEYGGKIELANRVLDDLVIEIEGLEIKLERIVSENFE